MGDGDMEGNMQKKLIALVLAVFTAGALAMAEEPLADLIVTSVDFQPLPREGGYIDSIKISVANRGKAPADKCVLNLGCSATKCSSADSCSELSRLISADIPVPSLKSGESVVLEWSPASVLKWPAGKYSVVAAIDKYNAVRESNETNNTAQSAVYIKALSPRPY